MKKWVLSYGFLLFVSIFNMATVYAFSNQDFKGGYAFQLVGPSSIALESESRTVATGQLLSDGLGHVSGHGSFHSAGITCMSTITGNYNMRLNGIGLLTTTINSDTPGCVTKTLALVIILSEKGVRFDVVSTENNHMIGQLTRQDKTGFTPRDLSGSYAMHLSGASSVVNPNQSLTIGVGVLSADGAGKIAGIGTLRSAGVTCNGAFTGIYDLADDGTGTISTKFSTRDPGCFTSIINLSVAVFKKGNAAEIANSENDYLAGSLNRQFLK